MENRKQLFSISIVKNEMDIIESFVRYHVNIFDGMIILDNVSTDNTLEILRLLKSDGLPLLIIEDKNSKYDQLLKMNQLLLKAVNEFEADIIIPLDADEFIISKTGENPRKILEKIEPHTFWYVKWKTYVPEFRKNKKFIPSNITLVRDESLEIFNKIIMPKEIIKDFNAGITKGNHDLIYEKKYEDLIKSFHNPNLSIAHYPIRSKEQLLSKIIIGWTNRLHMLDRTEGESFHIKNIFNKLKENQDIENQDVINFAKEYALLDEVSEVNVREDPIDLSFCNNIEIKYSDKQIDPMANVLEACEALSLNLLNLKKEKLEGEQRLNIQIQNLSLELKESYTEHMKEEKLLISKLDEYENSNSWLITSPLRKFGYKLKNLRK